MVSVIVDMVFSGANGNGNVEIAGLPFAAHSGPYVRFAGDVTLLTAGLSWSNQIACYINDNNSHVLDNKYSNLRQLFLCEYKFKYNRDIITLHLHGIIIPI